MREFLVKICLKKETVFFKNLYEVALRWLLGDLKL